MAEKLISGDNHIDLTYLPPDLWSSEAPNKWKLLAPRVEEMDDGLHWFVDAQDKGMWNGIVSLTDYQRQRYEPARGARLICVSAPMMPPGQH